MKYALNICIFITAILGVIFSESCSTQKKQVSEEAKSAPIIEDKTVALTTISQDGISFVIDSTNYGKISYEKIKKQIYDEPGPMMDAPEHICVYLEDTRPLPAFEKGGRYFFPGRSTICVFPLEDKSVDNYLKSYPVIYSETGRLLDLLWRDINPLTKNCGWCVPDIWESIRSAGNSMHAKYSKIKFQSGEGIVFLTQYSQDMLPSPANCEELTYSFQGLTNDRKYFVAGAFAVIHPQLPKGIDFTRDIGQRVKKVNGELEIDRGYLEEDEKLLEGFTEESFSPSLKKLQALISSIKVESLENRKK